MNKIPLAGSIEETGLLRTIMQTLVWFTAKKA